MSREFIQSDTQFNGDGESESNSLSIQLSVTVNALVPLCYQSVVKLPLHQNLVTERIQHRANFEYSVQTIHPQLGSKNSSILQVLKNYHHVW